jgi:cell wall-associated NlpC family hydrolase
VSYPTSPVSFGMPGRIADIESRFGQVRPQSTSTTRTAGTAGDFDTLLAAETARLEGVIDQHGGVTLGPAAGLGSGAGQAVIDAARAHLGVPYRWGGTDPDRGFDCSGLIQDAYRAIGVEMPKWSRHQATMGAEISSIDQALPGDVLSFGNPVNHVALYAGDGLMLHAPRQGEVVRIEPINRTIGSIRRIVSPTPAPSPVAAGFTGAPARRSAPSGAELGYAALFGESGRRWAVDPALLAAIAQAESGFNPTAVSPTGAQGLMQFMPQTAASMGVDPWDPASAIDGAARYMRASLDQFDTFEEAIASYNAGTGAVARHGGVPPYRETRNYVRTVLDAWRART